MNDAFFIQQLENKYPDFLRSIIRGEVFVPIQLRGGKQKPSTTDELHKSVKLFRQHERTGENPGWTIEWKPWNTKKFGRQIWPESIILFTEEDYLFLLRRDVEVSTFRTVLGRLLTWNPLVREWLAENPLSLLKHRNHWDSICTTIDFLLRYDVSAFYMRSLPIPVHSKFVEQNKTVLRSLLSHLDVQRFPKDKSDLEEALSLVQLPHLYPLRWLDLGLSSTYTAGLDILAVPYRTLLKTDWAIKEIWVVENETNLYLLPDRADALAIFAMGKALHNLKNIPFFAAARIFYWGDLDEDGFEMLDRFRRYYPQTVSILMDEKTVLYHRPYIHTVPFRRTPNYDGFTAEERSALRLLWDAQGRLEQEKLEQHYVQQYIKKIN